MQRDDGSLWIADRHDRTIQSYHIHQGDSNDCGPHVVTMIANFMQGRVALDADAIAHAMNRPRLGGFPPIMVRRIPNWATFPWGISDMLAEHGVRARWQFRASEDDLRAALREDRVPLPIFGEPLRRRGWKWTGWSHVALLVGWNPASDTYWFVDPARTSAPTGRQRAKFLDLWDNMGRILIETLE